MVALHSGPLRLLSVVQVCLFAPSSHSSYSSSLSFLLLLQWDKETQNKRRFQKHTHTQCVLSRGPSEWSCRKLLLACLQNMQVFKSQQKGNRTKIVYNPQPVWTHAEPSLLLPWLRRKRKKKLQFGGRKIHHTPPVSLCMFMISPCVFRRLRCYGSLHGNMWRPSW